MSGQSIEKDIAGQLDEILPSLLASFTDEEVAAVDSAKLSRLLQASVKSFVDTLKKRKAEKERTTRASQKPEPSKSDRTCCVCFEPPSSRLEFAVLLCGHDLCKPCAVKCTARGDDEFRCPVCRKMNPTPTTPPSKRPRKTRRLEKELVFEIEGDEEEDDQFLNQLLQFL